MPRLATRIPVPFATIACSNEIFVPSANDVTMLGFCPQRLGEFRLRRRSPVRIVETLDVAAQHGPQADPFHEPVEVHHHAGLVAVDIGVDDAGAIGLDLQDRAECPVELGIHQHDVLAGCDAGEDRRQRILDGARRLEEDVDALRLGNEHRIGRHRGASLLEARHPSRLASCTRQPSLLPPLQ